MEILKFFQKFGGGIDPIMEIAAPQTVNEAKYRETRSPFQSMWLGKQVTFWKVTPQCHNINFPTICLLGF
jgi:hypothetical protein